MLQDCTEWPVNKCNVRKEVVSKSTPETACRKVINQMIQISLRFRESPLTGSEGEVRACGVRVRAWRGGVLRQGRDRHPGDPRGDVQPRAPKGGFAPLFIFPQKRDHGSTFWGPF